MGKLRVYCLKTLNKLSIYPLGNTPSAPSVTKAARLVEDDDAQSASVLHGGLQNRIPLLFARVVTDNPTAERGALVRVEMVTSELTAGHATDGMNKVTTKQIFEPVLIRVVGVGTTIEVIRRRVFTTLLVTCILQSSQHTCNDELIKDLRGTLPR